MKSTFTNTFFANNRAQLRARLPKNYPIVVIANGSLQRTADTTYPFQQESNFWYLTGLDDPDSILVIDTAHEYLVLPQTNHVKTVFDGEINIAEAQRRSGIASCIDSAEGWELLTHELQKKKAVYTIVPEPRFEPNARVYANPAQRYTIDKLRRRVAGLMLHDITNELVGLRMRKQPPEICAIERAVQITTETIAEVRSSANLTKFYTEYALEAAITQGFRFRGASGHAYAPIVASGKHATTLHYIANNGVLHNGELVVADVGAEFEHYAADITRTFALEKPSSRQQDVIDTVIEVQQNAVALLRPGVSLRDYEYAVAARMGKALVGLGLITNAHDMRGIRTYFPHASSHFLGLDVHDAADYEAPLEASMVLTCEPGIYIPEEGIGVRIEDDILITKTGNRNLSGDCSYAAYAI